VATPDEMELLRQLGRKRTHLRRQLRELGDAIGLELLRLEGANRFSASEAAGALGATRKAVYAWLERARRHR